MKMVNYEVTVFTGSLDHATTYNDVYIKLMGTDGESCRTQLRDYKGSSAFARGAVSLKYPPLNVQQASLSETHICSINHPSTFSNCMSVIVLLLLHSWLSNQPFYIPGV